MLSFFTNRNVDAKTVPFLIAGMVPYCHFTFKLFVSLRSTALA